ncbi:MAG: hypothetical protein BWY11_02327 [Firmicutes bacterium ADurb.Bin182]|nr:MAG: hypothetical protein BWY11_02327 [Firmicutes bacterium ADurb.Bin182]
MNEFKIPKRVSTALVNSLTAGVVPRVGLEHIAVGRKAEIQALLSDLDNTAQGAAAFKLITGRYGSGKSFMLQTIRNFAMDRDFVVADSDLSPERRLVGTKGQGHATYRELMTNLATRTRPDGGALEMILQKWITGISQKLMKENGLHPGDPALPRMVEESILFAAGELEYMVHGFDFSLAVATYYRGYKEADDQKTQAALRWLRGEFSTKTEARQALGVSAIIDDESWYDYIKLWAEFVTRIGYRGLILFIDEGVNLYKITNSIARTANYEKLLMMFNDTMQGKASHLAIFMGGTPQFVEDQRRGLYSYEALRTRLIEGRFSSGGFKNTSGPVLKLEMLSNEEIFLLLQKLRALHSGHHGYQSKITDEELVLFMETAVGRMGADALLTPREVIRDFMDIQDVLLQNPDVKFEELVKDHKVKPASKDPDEDLTGFLTEFEL